MKHPVCSAYAITLLTHRNLWCSALKASVERHVCRQLGDHQSFILTFPLIWCLCVCLHLFLLERCLLLVFSRVDVHVFVIVCVSKLACVCVCASLDRCRAAGLMTWGVADFPLPIWILSHVPGRVWHSLSAWLVTSRALWQTNAGRGSLFISSGCSSTWMPSDWVPVLWHTAAGSMQPCMPE